MKSLQFVVIPFVWVFNFFFRSHRFSDLSTPPIASRFDTESPVNHTGWLLLLLFQRRRRRPRPAWAVPCPLGSKGSVRGRSLPKLLWVSVYQGVSMSMSTRKASLPIPRVRGDLWSAASRGSRPPGSFLPAADQAPTFGGAGRIRAKPSGSGRCRVEPGGGEKVALNRRCLPPTR